MKDMHVGTRETSENIWVWFSLAFYHVGVSCCLFLVSAHLYDSLWSRGSILCGFCFFLLFQKL